MMKPLVVSIVLLFAILLPDAASAQASIQMSRETCELIWGLVPIALPASDDPRSSAAFEDAAVSWLTAVYAQKNPALLDDDLGRYQTSEGTPIPESKVQAFRLAALLYEVRIAWLASALRSTSLDATGIRSQANPAGYDPADLRCKMSVIVLWDIYASEVYAQLQDEEAKLEGRQKPSRPNVDCGADLNILPVPNADAAAFHSALAQWLLQTAQRQTQGTLRAFSDAVASALLPSATDATVEGVFRHALATAAYDLFPQALRLGEQMSVEAKKGAYSALDNLGGYDMRKMACQAQRVETYTALYESALEMLDPAVIATLQETVIQGQRH